MKKISGTFVACVLIICMMLGGCGTSSDNITDAPAADVATDNDAIAESCEEQLKSQNEEVEIWEKAPNDIEVVEPVTEPTLDEVIEAVFNYAESEGMVVAGQIADIKEKIKTLYIAEGHDAFNIFQLLCDEGEFVAVSAEPQGILVLRYISEEPFSTKGEWKYEKSSAFTIKIDSINPDKGSVQNLRTFPIAGDNVKCCMSDNGLGKNVSQALALFNSDLTQMAVTKIMEDGSEHAGWIDEKGNYTDVSKMVTADAGDFGGITKHGSPCFTPDNCFCFADFTGSTIQIKKVPLENLTESAVEIVASEFSYLDYISPLPNGTIDVDSVVSLNYSYYNEEMTFPARSGFFYDWISENQCVGVEKNMIYKYILSGNKDDGIRASWYNEKIELIPEIKGRENWNPVVSPGADRVAFLSKLIEGTDQSTYLYIVPTEGGNPVKVSVDYLFTNDMIYRGNGQECRPHTYPMFTLMAWE